MNHVLVVGASGLVGRAAIDAFLDDDWRVTAVSRRAPEVNSERSFRHLALDLLDPDSAAELATIDAVTHVLYAAVYEKPGLVAGWSDSHQMTTNLAMLQNVVAPLVAAGALRHVTLMQGTKAYGVHLHPIPLPARERHPRDDHANFYWLQEDYLRGAAEQHGFDWTILRPVGVVGPAHGVGYCTPPVIGVFAALCREDGFPFGFPGGEVFPARQVVDVRLVANAIRWAASAPAARGEHFNLPNGEVFSWEQLWPVLADVMGVEAAPPTPVSLGQLLPAKADTWDRIVAKRGLRPLSISQVIGQSHLYADYTFGFGSTQMSPAALVSSVKVKQAGFTEVRDTEDTFRYSLETLIEQGVLPDYRGGRR